MTKRQVTAIVALAVVITLAPAALRAEKLPIDHYIVGCIEEPGMELMSADGREFHVVGEIERGVNYDVGTFEEMGVYVNVVNVQVKLPTEKVRVCGTSSVLLYDYSPTNTFDGTWNLKIGPMGIAGRALAHGTFANRRDVAKLAITSVPPDAIPVELQEILSRRPWTKCDRISGPNRVTGFIRRLPKE